MTVCASSRTRATIGVARLYGKFATSFQPVLARRATSRGPPSRASPCTTRTLGTLATTSSSAGIRCPSSSSAVTDAPASASATVSEPTPGPISRTSSPAATAPSRTIRRAVLGSTRKFWPRARLGRRPWRSSSSVIDAGVSRATGPCSQVRFVRTRSDGQERATRDDALAQRGQPPEHVGGEIDDVTSPRLGAPVRHPALRGGASGAVRERDDRAELQREVRARPAPGCRAVPGGRTRRARRQWLRALDDDLRDAAASAARSRSACATRRSRRRAS